MIKRWSPVGVLTSRSYDNLGCLTSIPHIKLGLTKEWIALESIKILAKRWNTGIVPSTISDESCCSSAYTRVGTFGLFLPFLTIQGLFWLTIGFYSLLEEKLDNWQSDTWHFYSASIFFLSSNNFSMCDLASHNIHRKRDLMSSLLVRHFSVVLSRLDFLVTGLLLASSEVLFLQSPFQI